MSGSHTPSKAPAIVVEYHEEPARSADSAPPPAAAPEQAVTSATHALLFDEPAEARCDVCGEAVPEDDEPSDDAPYALAGRGLYVWARGDEVRYEEPPLCPSCAAALGLSALARWEIEEEEG